MTALQNIIKEAKLIRKKYPKKEWKDCVKEAGAKYRSAHKTVKKKAVKKFGVVKKKAVKKKALKKVAKKKVVKKPGEKSVLKAIKHAVKVQQKHMSVGSAKSDIIKSIHGANKDLMYYEKSIALLQKNLHDLPLASRKKYKEIISKYKKIESELKTHVKELKKHI
jgi:hypothetical protein